MLADVAVGMNTDAFITSKTLISLTKMFNAYQDDFAARLILVEGGCADFAGSRNKLVRAFLNTDIQWLLIVDTDMVWQPEDWERLRDSADAKERPLVAGTYFVDNDPIRPCCAIFGEDGKVGVPNLREDSPELVQVSAACLGFGLIHRDVFYRSAELESDHEWFEHGWKGPNGSTLSEDYCFANRVGAAGIPIYINTKVRVGHLKPRVLGWDEYQAQLAPPPARVGASDG